MKSFSNRQGKVDVVELNRCPKCGLYSGARRCTVNLPERYYIVCESCGFKVGGYKSQPNATRRWNHESEKKWGK